MDRFKWLLVGAGDISRKRVAPALSSIEGSQISAICDVRAVEANALAEQYDSQVYTDLEQALSSSNADAVYLATPVGLHSDQAVKALEAGKHVIVEKPLGLDGPDCAKVVSAAQASGRYASCAYFRRFSPRYKHAKAMIESGEFGQVVSVRMTYFSWFNPTADDPKYWRVERAKSGGGPLSDMGTHMFDALIGLFGMPVSVYAKCGNLTTDWDVEDSAAIIMKLRHGALLTASFNWNSKTWRHEFEIVGTEAKLNWLPYDSGPVVKTVGRSTENIDLPNPENVHLPLVEDFVQAVREGHAPTYTVEESAKTNILLDAVYLSAEKNREVIP